MAATCSFKVTCWETLSKWQRQCTGYFVQQSFCLQQRDSAKCLLSSKFQACDIINFVDSIQVPEYSFVIKVRFWSYNLASLHEAVRLLIYKAKPVWMRLITAGHWSWALSFNCVSLSAGSSTFGFNQHHWPWVELCFLFVEGVHTYM